MRGYDCYIYHLENKKLVKNCNTACWNGLNRPKYNYCSNKSNIILDDKTKDYIYIDEYIEPQITDNQRKRIIYLINKITPCKFKKINNKIYIRYKLLDNHYSNLLLLNFIRILWYPNKSFNNKQFFIDICKPKTKNLDYLEFMTTCIKNNVNEADKWSHGDHSFVYPNIIPKTKNELLKYKGNSMERFLKKVRDI